MPTMPGPLPITMPRPPGQPGLGCCIPGPLPGIMPASRRKPTACNPKRKGTRCALIYRSMRGAAMTTIIWQSVVAQHPDDIELANIFFELVTPYPPFVGFRGTPYPMFTDKRGVASKSYVRRYSACSYREPCLPLPTPVLEGRPVPVAYRLDQYLRRNSARRDQMYCCYTGAVALQSQSHFTSSITMILEKSSAIAV